MLNQNDMPKLKTRKAVKKRVQVKIKKKGGKKTVSITKRADGQNHFNSRESGKVKRNKRNDTTVSKTLHKKVLRSLPHA